MERVGGVDRHISHHIGRIGVTLGEMRGDGVLLRNRRIVMVFLVLELAKPIVKLRLLLLLHTERGDAHSPEAGTQSEVLGKVGRAEAVGSIQGPQV